MRNFRKAALAGATAVAVAFGSTAVAAAEDATPSDAQITPVEPRPKTDNDGTGEQTTANKVAHRVGAVDEDGNLTGARGTDIFGEEKNWEVVPGWGKIGYVTTIFLSVSAVVGLIVGPLYNYIVHGM